MPNVCGRVLWFYENEHWDPDHFTGGKTNAFAAKNKTYETSFVVLHQPTGKNNDFVELRTT